MDTRLLEVFLAVAETGGLSSAARRLSFSQPAISQQIKTLERELGTPLLSRDGGKIELTEAGRTLREHARLMLSTWHVVRDQVRLAATLVDRVTLTIGSFPTANAAIVPDAVMELMAVRPELRVTVVEAEPPFNLDLLRSGQCDAVMSFDYPGDTAVRGVIDLPILEETFVLLVPERHPLAGAGEVELEAMEAEQWIAGCPGCRQHMLHSCSLRGFEPDIRCATDDLAMVRRLVANDMGIAMRPALNVVSEPLPGVSILRITDGPRRRISLKATNHDEKSLEVNALYRALVASARRLVDEVPKELAGLFVLHEAKDMMEIEGSL